MALDNAEATTLARQLIRHEGLRLKPYTDTVGKLTIGVGRNLTDVGITEAEALALLQHDINVVYLELSKLVWFRPLDAVRQRVVMNMAFNLGVPQLLTFTKTLGFVATSQYRAAANEMLQSKWAAQVGARARELAEQMRTGVDSGA